MGLEKLIGESWVPVIGREFEQEYLLKMAAWLSYTRDSKTIYPESEDVFRALQLCPAGQVKVVILGKSPYYQPGVADGLAFSYKGGMQHLSGLQSLDVMLDEIERDCYNGFEVNKDYDLTYLAKQGVLLLNSVMTVFKGQPDSHKDIGWQRFISNLIWTQTQDSSPKVFIAMGNEAKIIISELHIAQSIHNNGHLAIKVFHPAADLHRRDVMGQVVARYPEGFTGCGCFSKVNEFLTKNELTPIDWLNTKEPFLNPTLTKDGQYLIGVDSIENEKGYPKSWS